MRGTAVKRIRFKIEKMDPDILLKIRNLHGEQTKNATFKNVYRLAKKYYKRGQLEI
jgi:hypothetical protein